MYKMKKVVYIVSTIVVTSFMFISLDFDMKPHQLFTSNIPSIPILMYHRIVEDESEANLITLTLKRFEEDLAYLKNEKYTPISFSDLIDFKQ